MTAIVFHQLFEGLSLGIRIATLPAAAARGAWVMIAILQGRVADLHADVAGIKLLKPILAVSFAITTPVGIGIGLAAFEPGRSEGGECRLLPHVPPITARTDDLTCFCGICSEGHADPGADVRAVGGDAHLRVVRGDARG